MPQNRIVVLFAVLATIAVTALGAWIAGSSIESPADAAARTAAPAPSAILVPVEKRVLGSSIVTRGTGRYGLPQPVSIAPSNLKPRGLITTLPTPNTPFEEGDVMLTASGRPVFAIQGDAPAYRDLTPGTGGDDVAQLEGALKRLGFDPGAVDGKYDQRTGAAVAKWYAAKGWEALGPTRDQLAGLRSLEREWADALKVKLGTATEARAARPAVASAIATAEHEARTAEAELAARSAARRRLMQSLRADTAKMVESERANASYATAAAEAELEAQLADRTRIELDPRQPETVRTAANAKLALARAAVERTRLQGELAVQAAERAALGVGEQLKQAESAETSARLAVKSIRLQGEKAVRAARNAEQVANLDAELARSRESELAGDLAAAKRRIGIQVPVDEIVFIPFLPVRVQEIKAVVGGAATGTVLTVTDNQLSVDGSLTLDAAPLVTPGMPVTIDERALGVRAAGVVRRVASTPGTNGVDGFHVYFEVQVEASAARLDGVSVRLTIPIKSTRGAVVAVPNSAVSLATDGSSRIQVQRGNALQYVAVTPGLSAEGFVEVTPVTGNLEPGEMVVIGYDSPEP